MEIKDQIIRILKEHSNLSSSEIHEKLNAKISYSTIKRILANLAEKKLIEKKGNRKGIKYRVGKSYDLLHSIDIEEYFKKEIDERKIQPTFNFQLLEKGFNQVDIFTESELRALDEYQSNFAKNIAELSDEEYLKEIERLAIDLSWKSSQIEGNTYTLLGTERLLKEKRPLRAN